MQLAVKTQDSVPRLCFLERTRSLGNANSKKSSKQLCPKILNWHEKTDC